MKNESRLGILGQAALEKSVDCLRSSRLYRWFSQWFDEPGQQAPLFLWIGPINTPRGGDEICRCRSQTSFFSLDCADE